MMPAITSISEAGMNHIYRVIRSRTHGALVAVSELSGGGRRNKRRSARRLAALLSGLLPAALVCAAPVGGGVSAGSGSIAQNGNTTTIQQNSDRLAINWNSFNIGANESVRFNQPGAHAIALNRVLGQDPSQILGNLSANGQVFILNPNGVLFGNGAQVNVGGLVATTMKLSDNDFMNGNGKYVFTPGGVAGASVVNQGEITANGGYIALLAPKVINEGKLIADGGNVTMAAGTEMTLTLAAHSLLTLSIDQGAVDALAANHQLIQADGGVVLLSSKGQDAVLSGVVNNTGVIQARTVSNQNGEIRLMAHGGTAMVDGELDASASAGGNGGFIDTSGGKVKIADSVQVTTAAANGQTGMWLIDPNDFVIANSGGDIMATTLSAMLGGTNVTFKTVNDGHAGNGDIFVNDAVSWNSANTLTLEAERNINLNAAINAGQGGLTLNAVNTISAPAAVNVKTFTLNGGNWMQNSSNLAAFSAQDFRINNGSFLRAAGGDGSSGNAYRITDVYGLQGVGSSTALLARSYRLNNDIDATGTANWNNGAGFVPIGNFSNSFKGNFDGQGYAVANMTINRLSQNYVGLFGQVENGSLSNIGVIGGNFVGAAYVGALVGSLLNSSVHNAHATGSTSGNEGGSDFVGGLVGVNYQGSSITKSFATGTVSGINNVGGLVGWNYGQIDQAYASGNVNGQFGVGGLAGLNDGGQIRNAYATGAVSGNTGVGGLIGNIQDGGQVRNTYASGAVTGSGSNIGGLIGSNEILTPGASLATIDASYWNTQTSGRSSSAGGEGRSTLEMQGGGSRPIFAGWDFASIWKQEAAAPVFLWNFIPKTVASITQPPALTDTINALLASIALDAKGNIKTIDLEAMLKPASSSVIEEFLKSKADIDAENKKFIAEQLARMQNPLDGIDTSNLSAADLQTLENIKGQFDSLMGNLVKTALENSKLDSTQLNNIIAELNKKMDGGAPPDLSKAQPLDNTRPASAAEAAKAAKQAELEVRKNALGERNAERDKAQADLKAQAVAMETAANQQWTDAYSQMTDLFSQMSESMKKIVAGISDGAPAGATTAAPTPGAVADPKAAVLTTLFNTINKAIENGNLGNSGIDLAAMVQDAAKKNQTMQQAGAAQRLGDAMTAMDAGLAAADQTRTTGQQQMKNTISAGASSIANGAGILPGVPASGERMANALAAATAASDSRTSPVRDSMRDVLTNLTPPAGRSGAGAGSTANAVASALQEAAAFIQKGRLMEAEAAQIQNRVSDLLGK
jgi:filamentous hemagglutinin family protein